MTTVVVAGRFGPGSLENFYLDAFRSIGIAARHFALAETPGNRYLRRAFGPVLEARARQRDQSALSAEDRSVDLVVGVKPALWGLREIQRLRSTFPRAHLAIYLPDDPVEATRGGHFRRRALKALPEWDSAVTWTTQQVTLLRGLGVKRAVAVPFGWAPEHRSSSEQLQTTPEFDIGFIGAWDRERERVLVALASRCPEARLTVQGPRWPAAAARPNLTVRGCAVYGTDMVNATLSAAISLNIPRPQNVRNHNMRVFELAAMGAVQVTSEILSTEEGGPPPLHHLNEIEALLHCVRSSESLIEQRHRAWASVGESASYNDRARLMLEALA